MSAFVELIKRIGIFMIAAQVVIHFAPGQKYEKYIKMIVGVMILLQFLTPVYQILTKTVWEERDWDELIGDEMTAAMPQVGDETESVMDTMVKQMEEEIKSRLNTEIEGEEYCVVSVSVSMQTLESGGEYGRKQYELDTVRVIVRRTYSIGGKETQDSTNKIEKVQIQKIDVTLDTQNIQEEADEGEAGKEEADLDEREAKEEEFRKRFCGVLGMEEKYMEVSVYGAVDENIG